MDIQNNNLSSVIEFMYSNSDVRDHILDQMDVKTLGNLRQALSLKHESEDAVVEVQDKETQKSYIKEVYKKEKTVYAESCKRLQPLLGRMIQMIAGHYGVSADSSPHDWFCLRLQAGLTGNDNLRCFVGITKYIDGGQHIMNDGLNTNFPAVFDSGNDMLIALFRANGLYNGPEPDNKYTVYKKLLERVVVFAADNKISLM